MLDIFYNIFPIFCLIGIGYITKNKFIHSEDFWKGSEKITYYLLFPALLINGLVSVDLSTNLNSIIIPLLSATLCIGIVLMVLQKLFSIEKGSFTSYFQGWFVTIATFLSLYLPLYMGPLLYQLSQLLLLI